MSESSVALVGLVPSYLVRLIPIKELATFSDREVDILKAVVAHEMMTNTTIIDTLKKAVLRATKELGDCAK